MPDEQRADQAGALRYGYAVDVVQRHPGLVQRLADDGRDELEVAARGNFGDDPAVPRVELRLRGDHVCQDVTLRA